MIFSPSAGENFTETVNCTDETFERYQPPKTLLEITYLIVDLTKGHLLERLESPVLKTDLNVSKKKLEVMSSNERFYDASFRLSMWKWRWIAGNNFRMARMIRK
jgi:hypothetical protein